MFVRVTSAWPAQPGRRTGWQSLLQVARRDLLAADDSRQDTALAGGAQRKKERHRSEPVSGKGDGDASLMAETENPRISGYPDARR